MSSVDKLAKLRAIAAELSASNISPDEAVDALKLCGEISTLLRPHALLETVTFDTSGKNQVITPPNLAHITATC